MFLVKLAGIIVVALSVAGCVSKRRYTLDTSIAYENGLVQGRFADRDTQRKLETAQTVIASMREDMAAKDKKLANFNAIYRKAATMSVGREK